MNATGSQGQPRRDVRALESPVNLDPVGIIARRHVRRARDASASAPGWAAEAVKPSTISTAQLHRLPGFHMPPIEQVISLRSYPVDPVGNLILRRASHLDAFSAYPDRT